MHHAPSIIITGNNTKTFNMNKDSRAIKCLIGNNCESISFCEPVFVGHFAAGADADVLRPIQPIDICVTFAHLNKNEFPSIVCVSGWNFCGSIVPSRHRNNQQQLPCHAYIVSLLSAQNCAFYWCHITVWRPLSRWQFTHMISREKFN